MAIDLLVATGNQDKLREYRALLAAAPARLLSLHDVGLTDFEVEEDGKTLRENATLKARAYSRASGMIALADDTGLMVDALDGAPGVYAARYGGPGLTMPQRRAKLLQAMADVPDEKRAARFACVIAVAIPDGEIITVDGACEGRVAQLERDGLAGFGYDAIFIPDGYDISWGSIPREEKNRVSHRGKAVRKIIPVLERLARG